MEKPPPASGSQLVPSTTYVQADATVFREVVQRLTGPIGGGGPPQRPGAPAGAATLRSPSPTTKSRVAGVKRPPLGLHERRQGPPRQALVIPRPAAGLQPFAEGGAQARSPLVSPSTCMAGLSLGGDGEEPGSAGGALGAGGLSEEEEEEKAIREKRFYLHPSPRSGQETTVEPALLPLFPTSATTSSSSAELEGT